MKKSPNSKWQLYRRILIGLAIFLAIALIPLGISEFKYQQKISSMKNIATSIGDTVVIPNGGSAKGNIRVDAQHLWESLCIDSGPCPSVSAQWLVPVEKGAEKDFIGKILNRDGDIVVQDSANGQSGEGRKDGYKVNISLSEPYSNEVGAQQAPVGKEWRLLSVAVY